jgi:DnaK suppressor protein
MQHINSVDMDEKLTDISDIASRNEQIDLAKSLAAWKSSSAPSEAPDEDANGNRYCLDCGNDIPAERVQVINAVRCVACTTRRERIAKIGRHHGGCGYGAPNEGSIANVKPRARMAQEGVDDE